MTHAGDATERRSLRRTMSAALGPIGLVYAYRTLIGALVALPAEGALRAELSSSPGGDRDVMHGGGALLVEALWRAIPRVRSASAVTPWIVLLASVIALVPLAAMLHALASDGRARLTECLLAALRRFPPLVLLLGCAAIAEALAAVFVVQATTIAGDPFASPRSAWIALTIGIAASLPLLVVSLVHDAARVGVAARNLGFYDASARALRLVRRRPGALLFASTIVWLATLVLVFVTLAAPLWIGMASAGGWIAVTVVQQLAVLGLVLVRAGYFARLTALDRFL